MFFAVHRLGTFCALCTFCALLVSYKKLLLYFKNQLLLKFVQFVGFFSRIKSEVLLNSDLYITAGRRDQLRHYKKPPEEKDTGQYWQC